MLENYVQITIAALVLMVIALPTGLLFLRAVRLFQLNRWRENWILFPVALVSGLLIIPLTFNIAAYMNAGHLPNNTRIGVWVILNIGLYIVGTFIAWTQRRRLPEALRAYIRPPVNTLPPTFELRWQACVLIGMGVFAFIITLHPLTIHNTHPPTAPDAVYRLSMHDWSKHLAVGTALATSDRLPPPNPFLATEPTLHFHYFPYILPTMIHQFIGVTLANSQIAAAVLIAFCLPFMVFNYASAVGLGSSGALFSAFLVSMVGGLDFIYMVLHYIREGWWLIHIDGWANHAFRRINGIPDMYIWTPQHILGLCGFILALWLIKRLDRKIDALAVAHVLGLGVILAAVAGTSTLTWFALGLGIGLFLLFEIPAYLFWNVRSIAPLLLSAGIVSVFLALPYMRVALARDEAPFMFYISPTKPGIEYGGIFSYFWGETSLNYALDFPFQMVAEFGALLVLGVAGWWMVRKQWRHSHEIRFWTLFLLMAYVLVLAVREGRLDTNNYAPRVAPLAMVILGVLSGFWWEGRREGRLFRWKDALSPAAQSANLIKLTIVRVLLWGMVVVGVLGALYEPIVQRDNTYVAFSTEWNLVNWLNANLTDDDIYQIGAETGEMPLVLVQHRTGFSDWFLAQIYTSDLRLYRRAAEDIQIGYAELEADDAARAFQRARITIVVTAPHIPLMSSDDPDFERWFELLYFDGYYGVYRVQG